MNYQVVFEASQKGYDWWWLVIPLIFAIGLFFAWRFRRYFPLPSRLAGMRVVVLLTVTILASCLFIAAFVLSYMNYTNAHNLLRQGNTQVVEGVVEDFKPLPAFDKGDESFSVSDVKFAYSPATLTPGFNQASTHGGPINKNGLQVKVHYYHDPSTDTNVIVKLELAK